MFAKKAQKKEPYCAGIPSIQEEKRLKTEEKERIELQKQQLG